MVQQFVESTVKKAQENVRNEMEDPGEEEDELPSCDDSSTCGVAGGFVSTDGIVDEVKLPGPEESRTIKIETEKDDQ